MMLMFMIMVMVLVRSHLSVQKFLFQRYRIFHDLQHLLSIELVDRRSDDRCRLINPSQQLHSLLRLLLIHDIGPAHHHSPRKLYLIIKKLAEIAHIHLTLLSVYHGGIAVQRHLLILFSHILNRLDHVRQLAHAGGLDQDPVRMILRDHFL